MENACIYEGSCQKDHLESGYMVSILEEISQQLYNWARMFRVPSSNIREWQLMVSKALWKSIENYDSVVGFRYDE